jgi:hypothetical protein
MDADIFVISVAWRLRVTRYRLLERQLLPSVTHVKQAVLEAMEVG